MSRLTPERYKELELHVGSQPYAVILELLDEISALRADLKESCEAFNEILGDISKACGERPAWTSTHQATLVHKTMVLAGNQRDAIEKCLGQRGPFAPRAGG